MRIVKQPHILIVSKFIESVMDQYSQEKLTKFRFVSFAEFFVEQLYMKYGLRSIAMRNLVAILDRIIEGQKMGEKYSDLLFSAYGFGNDWYTDHKLEVFLKSRYVFAQA